MGFRCVEMLVVLRDSSPFVLLSVVVDSAAVLCFSQRATEDGTQSRGCTEADPAVFVFAFDTFFSPPDTLDTLPCPLLWSGLSRKCWVG